MLWSPLGFHFWLFLFLFISFYLFALILLKLFSDIQVFFQNVFDIYDFTFYSQQQWIVAGGFIFFNCLFCSNLYIIRGMSLNWQVGGLNTLTLLSPGHTPIFGRVE